MVTRTFSDTSMPDVLLESTINDTATLLVDIRNTDKQTSRQELEMFSDASMPDELLDSTTNDNATLLVDIRNTDKQASQPEPGLGKVKKITNPDPIQPDLQPGPELEMFSDASMPDELLDSTTNDNATSLLEIRNIDKQTSQPEPGLGKVKKITNPDPIRSNLHGPVLEMFSDASIPDEVVDSATNDNATSLLEIRNRDKQTSQSELEMFSDTSMPDTSMPDKLLDSATNDNATSLQSQKWDQIFRPGPVRSPQRSSLVNVKNTDKQTSQSELERLSQEDDLPLNKIQPLSQIFAESQIIKSQERKKALLKKLPKSQERKIPRKTASQEPKSLPPIIGLNSTIGNSVESVVNMPIGIEPNAQATINNVELQCPMEKGDTLNAKKVARKKHRKSSKDKKLKELQPAKVSIPRPRGKKRHKHEIMKPPSKKDKSVSKSNKKLQELSCGILKKSAKKNQQKVSYVSDDLGSVALHSEEWETELLSEKGDHITVCIITQLTTVIRYVGAMH